jgi:hypothetical protein
LNTIPELINGKVCILNSHLDTYDLYPVSRHISIDQKFDPLDYALLVGYKDYKPFIVYSSPSERRRYENDKEVKRCIELYYPKALIKAGHKIHLKSKSGTYTVLGVTKDSLWITCNKWAYEQQTSRIVPLSDFHKFAGGIHNFNM